MAELSAPIRLTIFGVALLIVFGVAYTAGSMLIPESFVDEWINQPVGH